MTFTELFIYSWLACFVVALLVRLVVLVGRITRVVEREELKRDIERSQIADELRAELKRIWQ